MFGLCGFLVVRGKYLIGYIICFVDIILRVNDCWKLWEWMKLFLEIINSGLRKGFI